MRKAVVIPADGDVRVIDLDAPEGSLKVLQTAVGGWIEAVDINDHLTMWCNEEGKLMGLLANAFATAMFTKRFGPVDIIVGDVVFTGGTDDEGETLGLTDEMVDTLTFVAA